MQEKHHKINIHLVNLAKYSRLPLHVTCSLPTKCLVIMQTYLPQRVVATYYSKDAGGGIGSNGHLKVPYQNHHLQFKNYVKICQKP